LYVWGSLDIKNKPILAVVGTRHCSNYGKQVTVEFVSKLTEAGFVIVSGLAKGVDTLAHRTALEKNGLTIAVLGSGIDRKNLYPKVNLGLAQEIVKKGGAIISEYPPGTRALYYHFPERNRIIAGLSLGVLVVEAKEKSGALITANHAFSQTKPVFAVPGSIYNPTSSGCHLLIKKGAKIVTSPHDILKYFGISYTKTRMPEGQTKEEEIILNLLEKKALHIDEIIQLSKIDPVKVIRVLTKLEIEGKVKNLGGNIFMTLK
jgi:DNA processing protein